MRKALTFHVSRITLVVASPNVGLAILILILIRILFSKQSNGGPPRADTDENALRPGRRDSYSVLRIA